MTLKNIFIVLCSKFFPLPEIMISAVFAISSLEHLTNLFVGIFRPFYLVRIKRFHAQISNYPAYDLN